MSSDLHAADDGSLTASRRRAGLQRHWLALATTLVLGFTAGLIFTGGNPLRVIRFLEPWEPSVTALVGIFGALVLYIVGLVRGGDQGFWRALAFFTGMLLIYLMLQSRYDYLSQHMFWVHRLQHLVLHHLAPLLVVLAVPQPVMMRALPRWVRARIVRPVASNAVVEGTYRLVQQPAISAILFVGLIYFWLIPEIHYDAMLSATLYKAMNWSMLIDGFLFWWMILDSHPTHRTRPSYGVRMLILWLIMIPQIMLGAYIALNNTDLYEVYDVCGRVWAVDPLLDQRIGGLITWIPASMMSVVVALIVLGMWLRDQRQTASEAGARDE